MSNTPRTDEQESRGLGKPWTEPYKELLQLARQLERELAAVTAERDALRARARKSTLCEVVGRSELATLLNVFRTSTVLGSDTDALQKAVDMAAAAIDAAKGGSDE